MNAGDADALCRLLPMTQASTVARVSSRTVRRWVAAGMLEPVDVGKAGRERSTPWRYVDEQQLLEAEREAWRARQRPAA